MNKIWYSLFLPTLVFLSGCYKKPISKSLEKNKEIVDSKESTIIKLNLDNNMHKTLYACVFYYTKRNTDARWEWYKSSVVKIDPSKTKQLSINTFITGKNIENVYGYLSIFDSKGEAEASILELLPNENQIDLGIIKNLDKKHILLTAKSYGLKGEKIEYNIPEAESSAKKSSSQDGEASTNSTKAFTFDVENGLNKDIIIACFIYDQQGAHPLWDFEKLAPQKVAKKTTTSVTFSTALENYDIDNVRAYLGVFDAKNPQEAQGSTYESLTPAQKLNLGLLKNINNKKIVIFPKAYGILAGFDDQHPDIEFNIKPPRAFPKKYLP